MAVRIFEWVTGSLERVLATLSSAAPVPDLADRPRVAIAAAPDGQRVRVVGRVVPADRTLRSPLSDRPCVFWELSIDRAATPPRAAAERRGSGWTTVQRAHRVVPFVLEDETGCASVRTEHFAGWSIRDARAHGGDDVVLDRPRLVALLDGHGIPRDRLDGNVRVREGVFEPGERIAVDARARWLDEGPAAAGYRGPARTRRLELVADPDDPVCASDDPEGPY